MLATPPPGAPGAALDRRSSAGDTRGVRASVSWGVAGFYHGADRGAPGILPASPSPVRRLYRAAGGSGPRPPERRPAPGIATHRPPAQGPAELTLDAIPTDATPAELVRGFVPTPRFAHVSFDSYSPDPREPTQAAAVARLRAFVAELADGAAAGRGLLARFRRRKAAGLRGLYLDGG